MNRNLDNGTIKNILEFWTHLEIFDFPRIKIAQAKREKTTPDKEKFYKVYAGLVRVQELFQFILENILNNPLKRNEYYEKYRETISEFDEFTYLFHFLLNKEKKLIFFVSPSDFIDDTGAVDEGDYNLLDFLEIKAFEIPDFWIYLLHLKDSHSDSCDFPSYNDILSEKKELEKYLLSKFILDYSWNASINLWILSNEFLENSKNIPFNFFIILAQKCRDLKIVVEDTVSEKNGYIKKLSEHFSDRIYFFSQFNQLQAILQGIQPLEEDVNKIAVWFIDENSRKFKIPPELKSKILFLSSFSDLPFYVATPFTLHLKDIIKDFLSEKLKELQSLWQYIEESGREYNCETEYLLKKFYHEDLPYYYDETIPSFYIDELNNVRNDLSKWSKVLKLYFQGADDKKELNESVEKEILQPKNLPFAAWPIEKAPVYHQMLVLCEIFRRFGNSERKGIVSVNGPPGTGKTTILRELIANIIVHRAKVLCDLENPFQEVSFSEDQNSGTLYKVSSELLGQYEILVCSSNNKAVENITREIPLRDKISEEMFNIDGEDWLQHDDDFRYFAAAASHILFSDSEQMNNVKCWGIITGILGKMVNRRKFISGFWGYGSPFKEWLFSKCESPQDDNSSDEFERISEKFNKIYKEVRLYKENLEKHLEVLRKESVTDLESLGKRIETWKKREKELNNSIEQLQSRKSNTLKIAKILESVIKNAVNLCRQIDVAVSKCMEEIERRKRVLQIIRLLSFCVLKDSSPFLAKRRRKIEILENIVRHLNKHKGLLLKCMDEIRDIIHDCNEEICLIDRKTGEKQKILPVIGNKVGSLTKTYEFFEKYQVYSKEDFKRFNKDISLLPDSEKYLSVPFVSDVFRRLQAQLFIYAMKVHFSFIKKHCKAIRENLELFRQMILPSKDRKIDPEFFEKAAPHLWATFFLCVPVVSTTFASLGNLMKYMKNESVGWVIIDEAGQAIPQAAVGALWRAKRAVVVGDPLQLEPVVTIPPQFIEFFAEKYQLLNNEETRHFLSGLSRAVQIGEGKESYLDSSVQILADRASSVGRYITLDGEGRYPVWIGLPLITHWRCSNPMFDISNRIAYNNMMISGKPRKEPPVESKWIDVYVNPSNKKENTYLDEINVLINYLRKLIAQYGNEFVKEKVYIITPFNSVKREIIQQCKIHNIELKLWGPDASIGTIHTFQGKENDLVILVLGGTTPGARRWAVEKPNLINVAVTRAKEAIVVIGNGKNWKNLPYIREVWEKLSRETIDRDMVKELRKSLIRKNVQKGMYNQYIDIFRQNLYQGG